MTADGRRAAEQDCDDDGTILEKDYCPPLDTALFYAVLSDLDPGNPESVRDIRQILAALKESAEVEQGTEFDPSGTTFQGKDEEATILANLAALSITEDSATTSITEQSSQADSIPDVYDEGIEELSDQEKINLLLELCPDARLFDIQFTLKKYKSSFRKSLDETLNLLWIKENHTVQRSIDGFFNEAPKARKSKGKHRSKQNSVAEYETHHEHLLPQQNIWQIRKTQIDFIASRVQLSESLVRSEYHKAGGSQRTTILNLCNVDLRSVSGASTEDTVIQMNAAELGQDFPGLTAEQCLALIVLTNPFTARAHELAQAVSARLTSGTSTPDLATKLIPQYIPLQLDNNTSTGSESKSQPAATYLNQDALRQSAAKHALLREQMFSKANAAWRKSKSNHLMGGAAAYYSDEGRRANASSHAFSSAAADAHIQTSATIRSIDLHGVNVQDALRNTTEAVQNWWSSGHAEWAREGKAVAGDGFTIITGVGAHSVGGKAKVRPAVVKMLKAEGWRIEEDAIRGQVIVLGRVRLR